MNYYLERVIPVLDSISGEDWDALLGRIRPFIKEIEMQNETLFRTLVLADSKEGIRLANEAGLPCLGLELGKEAETLACPYVVTDISAVTPMCMEQVYRRFYNLPWEILESVRCIVREGTEEDAAQILGIYEDIEEFSLTKPFANLEEGQRYMRDYRKMVYRLYEYGLWVVEEKESGKLLGVAGLENQIFQGQEYLALGYVIGKNWRGRGYGEEVCRAILDYGKNTLGLRTLHCFVELENEASIRLIEKLGFCRKEIVVQKMGENGGQEQQLGHYLWKV